MIIDSALQALESLMDTKNTNDNKELGAENSGSASGGDFMDFMRSALGQVGKGQISEEELFALLLEQRVGEISDEAKQHFIEAKNGFINSLRRGDGYVNIEEAAIQALRSTVQGGLVDETEGERIYSEAFRGAQLDDNHEELWDDRGSGSDPTIAVASIEEALSKLEMFINALNSGELEVPTRPLSSGSTGGVHSGGAPGSFAGGAPGEIQSQSMDGSGGFLWKPVSESDSKLVVLLPEALRGAVSRVEIHASLPPSDITKLGEGRFAGDTMNGNRPHFRFDKPGSGYGNDVHVVAYKDDGSMLTWNIKDGSQRHD
ncbi:MAG TPA: hypothetical protein PKA63_01255 [Oligoflexia bacterium]|nr:hypothetical protein [Oligoflexia bacterium]HMP47277.1 hypothetical protein [Oligoflexia bacterium]